MSMSHQLLLEDKQETVVMTIALDTKSDSILARSAQSGTNPQNRSASAT
jgi:hypothetical protein